MATQSRQSAALTSPGYLMPFITVTALFFIFGFITNLNMALVPPPAVDLRSALRLAMLAESAFFLAYFVFASPTSKSSSKPLATSAPWWSRCSSRSRAAFSLFPPPRWSVSRSFFQRSSSSEQASPLCRLRQTRMSRSLDRKTTSSIRLNLAQAFNSIGGTIAPLIAGAFILKDPRPAGQQGGHRQHRPRTLHSHRRRSADPGACGCVCPLARHRRNTGLPPRQGRRSGAEPQHLGLQAHGARRHRHLPLCGRRSRLASIAVNYFKTQGMSTAKTASFLVSLYWFGALVGRLLGSWMMTKIKAGQAAHHLRIRSHGSHHDFNVYQRPGGHRHPGSLRLL